MLTWVLLAFWSARVGEVHESEHEFTFPSSRFLARQMCCGVLGSKKNHRCR